MGIDIHIHDYYFVVGHVPTAIAVLVVALLVLFGAWKLATFLWAMLAR